MKFEQWIKKIGPKKLAVKLKVDASTVSLWRQRRAFPRPKKLLQIYRLSNGKVTYAEMIHHFLGIKEN